MQFSNTTNSILTSDAQMILNPVNLQGVPYTETGKKLFEHYPVLHKKMEDFVPVDGTIVPSSSIQIVHIAPNRSVVQLFIESKDTDLTDTIIHFNDVIGSNTYNIAIPESLLEVVDPVYRSFFFDTLKAFFAFNNSKCTIHIED